MTVTTEAPTKSSLMEQESVLGRVSQQLSHLEKRDLELWFVIAFSGLAVSAGLLAILFPSAFLNRDSFHFEVIVSKEIFVGLAVLLVILNTYLAFRRFELRRVRERLISTTLQSELVRLQSFVDPLTEGYNRRSLDDMAGRYIAYARRSAKPLTLVLIDVDRFKDINTKFGHLTGDLVLAEVAALLKHSIRGCDAVVRYGGDEFILILADSRLEGAMKVAERIQNGVLDWNRAGHLEKFTLDLSLGFAEWRDGMTLDEALDAADRDMYRHKDSRRTVQAPEIRS
jgi:diguanylate cyclase (GGDEF)-like protein